MKKAISLVLTILILICSMPCISAFSDSGTFGGCAWECDGNVLVISGNGAMSNFDRVTAPWGKNITEVVIEEGVTTVGQFAFADCKKLVSVSLPESLEFIRGNAFDGCSALKEITLPNSLKEIETSAFFGCSSLKTVVIPQSVTTISDYAFYQCSALQNVIVGNSLVSVGHKAFYRCTSLAGITLPRTLKTVKLSAFEGCDNLQNVWYEGNDTEKSSVTIGSKNNPLANALWNTLSVWNIQKEPTCRENGLVNIVCGEKTYIVHLSARSHVYGGWEVKKSPTCEEKGEKVRGCRSCSLEESAEIAPLGHSFGDWQTKTAPSCGKEGAQMRICDVCKLEENRSVAALEHNYNILTNYISATCKTAGETALKCSLCREVSTHQTTSGHVYKNGSCIYCNMGAKVVESKHNYDSNCDIKQKVTFPSAQKIAITFSEKTYTEQDYDFIYIIDGNGKTKSKSSGAMLRGRTITVDGNTVTIRLQSDESGEEYGYFATVTPISLSGDVNADGAVDALDIAAVMNGVLTGDKNLSFDINDDGLVNLVDLVRIKKMLAN